MNKEEYLKHKNELQEAKNFRRRKYVKKLTQIYDTAVEKTIIASIGIKQAAGVFDINKNAAFKKMFKEAINSLFNEQKLLLSTSIGAERVAANEDITDTFKKKYGKKYNRSGADVIHNEYAEEAVLDRKRRGVKLSQKVWNNTKAMETDLLTMVSENVAAGRGSKEAAKHLRSYLKNPEAINSALPVGRGVYRSPYKNALRLQVTETNMAYMEAEHDRYMASSFVVGYEVRLSDRHPMYDICDQLKGKYPKDFKFLGWHPFCLCHSVAIMLTQEQFNEMERDKFNGVDISKKEYSDDAPKGTPVQLKKWYAENKERSGCWTSANFWTKRLYDACLA